MHRADSAASVDGIDEGWRDGACLVVVAVVQCSFYRAVGVDYVSGGIWRGGEGAGRLGEAPCVCHEGVDGGIVRRLGRGDASDDSVKAIQLSDLLFL